MSNVTIRFAATTPPNAETGSQAFAAIYAVFISVAIAMPHGFAC
jgi:hypothetical protein